MITLAIINFQSVWGKVLDYANDRKNGMTNRGKWFNNRYVISQEYMEMIVRELLSELETKFMMAFCKTWTQRTYPFAGIFEESRVVCNKTSHGYDYIISFGGSDGELGRQSVLITTKKKTYRGKGIRNIISLFDTGYFHTHQLYGEWKSKSRGFVVNVGVRNYLYGLEVISQTIDDFQDKYREIGLIVKLIAPNEYYAR